MARALDALAGREKRGPVADAPFPFAFLQEGHLGRKGVIVKGRLDLEHPHVLAEQAANAPRRRVQVGMRPVHQRAAVLEGPDVVVVADTPVAHEAGRGGFVATVHGDQVDVHVDEQVGFGHPAVHLDVFAIFGLFPP